MVTGSSVFSKIFTPAENTGNDARMRRFAELLDRAGVQQTPQDIALRLAGVTAVLWILAALVMRPGMLVGVILVPVCAAVAIGGFWALLQIKIRRRLDQFVQQLELALRLIGSGVRIGLGLRQALTMVIEEMSDPARYEYMRVVGQTNIGVSVYDALDTLAKRMPGSETLMMARAIRIQSQTGGDLAKILEHLANTIKERRRIQRKISALTAEGRASAGILSALPPFLSVFISITEPSMGSALWFTSPGHVALMIVGVLELLGVLWLMKMLKVDV
jgi:tight adherence protein B